MYERGDVPQTQMSFCVICNVLCGGVRKCAASTIQIYVNYFCQVIIWDSHIDILAWLTTVHHHHHHQPAAAAASINKSRNCWSMRPMQSICECVYGEQLSVHKCCARSIERRGSERKDSVPFRIFSIYICNILTTCFFFFFVNSNCINIFRETLGNKAFKCI